MDMFIKILLIVIAALSCVKFSHADSVSDLVGLGMHPELAEVVAALSTTKANAAWFKATDQAGTGTIDILRVDATDDTNLNADSGDLVKFTVAKTPVAALGAATPVAAFTPQAVGNLVSGGSIQGTSFISSGAFTGAGLMVGTPVSGVTPAAGNVSIGGTLGVTGASTLGAVSLTSVSSDIPLAAGKQVQQAVAIITPSTNMTPAAASNLASPINRLVAGSPTLAAVHLPAATPNKGKTFFINNEGSNPVLVFPGGTNKINAGGAATPVSVAAGKLERCIVTQNDTSLCVLEN